jgi:hypothetical protein
MFHRTSKGRTGQPLKAFDKVWRKALAAAKLPPTRIFHDTSAALPSATSSGRA